MTDPRVPARTSTTIAAALACLTALTCLTTLAAPVHAAPPAADPLRWDESDTLVPTRYRPGFRGSNARRTASSAAGEAKPVDTTRPTTGSGPGVSRRDPRAVAAERTVAGRIRRFLSRQGKRPADADPQEPSRPTAALRGTTRGHRKLRSPNLVAAARPTSPRPTSPRPTFVPVPLADAANPPDPEDDFEPVAFDSDRDVTAAAESSYFDLLVEKGPRDPAARNTRPAAPATRRPAPRSEPAVDNFGFESVDLGDSVAARPTPAVEPAAARTAPAASREPAAPTGLAPVAATEPAAAADRRPRGRRSLFGLFRRRLGRDEPVATAYDPTVVPEPPPFVIPRDVRPLPSVVADTSAPSFPGGDELDDLLAGFDFSAVPGTSDGETVADTPSLEGPADQTSAPENAVAAADSEPAAAAEESLPSETIELPRVDLDDLFADLDGGTTGTKTPAPTKLSAPSPAPAVTPTPTVVAEAETDSAEELAAAAAPETDSVKDEAAEPSLTDDLFAEIAAETDRALAAVDAVDAEPTPRPETAAPEADFAPFADAVARSDEAPAESVEGEAADKVAEVETLAAPEVPELDLPAAAPAVADAPTAADAPAAGPTEPAEEDADDLGLFAALDLDEPQPEDDLVPDDKVPGYARVAKRTAAPAELSVDQRRAALTPEESYRRRLLERLETRAGLGGFQGFCPVILRDARDLIDARPEHVAIFEAVPYEFSTADARRRFRDDPTRYAPVNGGHDVVLTAAGEIDTRGTLLHAAWYRDRLYLFRNAESLRLFQAEPGRFEMAE